LKAYLVPAGRGYARPHPGPLHCEVEKAAKKLQKQSLNLSLRLTGQTRLV